MKSHLSYIKSTGYMDYTQLFIVAIANTINVISTVDRHMQNINLISLLTYPLVAFYAYWKTLPHKQIPQSIITKL